MATPDLNCPRCGASNREGRRYCAQCGSGLPAACAACGFANEAAERFCGGCGVPLVAAGALAAGGHAAGVRAAGTAAAGVPAAGAPAAPATGAPAIGAPAPVRGAAAAPPADASGEGQRRPVTVLFADLVDYTRMSRVLDPEDVHALLERYYEAVDDIVVRHGGAVDKHIGDALMAVFGAPIAHGDDALRAVRAAADIQQAMPSLAGAGAEPLAVHIGIASGEVIASGLGSARHRAYTVIGNSVNLAARLLKLAGAGETVLDDAVHAAVQRIARCVPIEGAQLKGIDAPVTAWRFADFGTAEVEGARPFVGRQAELAQLGAMLASCAAAGAGGTVFVRGDAGIGKSRLVGELRRLAVERGFACHTALVLDFGMATGRDAMREVVASCVQLAATSAAAARQEALARVLAAHPGLADAEPFLLDLLDLPQPASTRALYEAMDGPARQRGRSAAMLRVLDATREGAAALVVVEDVHWADRPTLECVAALTRGAATMPLVLALTSRVEGDPLDVTWRASVQGSPFVTIDLGPLAPRDALALAGGLVATGGFAEKCVARAAGNPLFLEQLLRAPAEGDGGLPASLASLVLARMDRLPPSDRAALRAAAVVGQRFPLALVRRLAGLPDYECSAPVSSFLVRPEGDEFLFAHALIRDGVYASLTRARRAELHRVAAEWYGERDPVLRAEHLDRAESPEAPRAYLVAAQAQAVALQPERALALAERGARLARERDDVFALNMMHGRLRCESGAGWPAVGAYTAALAVAREPEERCRALLGVAAGHRLTSGIDAALAALAEAEPLARANALTRELAELHCTRGNLHFARGDVVACGAEHDAALACARSLAEPLWEARALSGQADAAYAVGRMRTAFQRFSECVAMCDAHGLARVAIANRAMKGYCRIYLMDFDAGIADTESAHALARRLGDRYSEMFAQEALGVLLTFCDRYAEAEPVLVRALALAEAVDARRYQALLHAALAEVLLARGRVAEARERNARAHELALATGMRFCGPLVLAIEARMQDDARERERLRAEAESLLAAGAVGHSPIAYHRHGIEDAIARGEWDRGRRHVAALAAYTRDEPLPYTEFLMARARLLAKLAATPQRSTLQDELARLRAEAARVGWPIDWPEWALRGEPAPRSGSKAPKRVARRP